MGGARHAKIVSMAVASLRVVLGIAALIAATAACSGCALAAGESAPRRPGGFQNNYVEFRPQGFGAFLEWRVSAMRNGLPPAPRGPTPAVRADLGFIRSNAGAGMQMQPAITWIGHATMLLQIGGRNVLTDPMFSERTSPLAFIGPKRHAPPGVALADLPHIDAVLISHNHFDHLDTASVRALNAQSGGPPLFVVPLGLKAWLADQGIVNAVELDWWQARALGPIEIVLTPLQHWSGRGLGDRLATLWGGYALFAPEFQVFFAGDTAYSKDFADIRAHFADRQAARAGRGFDLALIPIGAYEPRWFMRAQHADPAEAVQIHLDVGAQRSVGIHWGTFELTDEALDQPPIDLAEARRARSLDESAFQVMAIGETRTFPRRSP